MTEIIINTCNKENFTLLNMLIYCIIVIQSFKFHFVYITENIKIGINISILKQ